MSKVAVIIVTYNGMKWMRSCLNSLIELQNLPKVFIVDNGSTDGTIEYIESNYPNFDLTKSAENLGFGKANNLALKKAYEQRFEYFFLLNQDAWIKPDTFDILIEQMKKNPSYGIISPMQYNGDGSSLDRNFSKLLNNDNCPGFINDCYFGKLKVLYEVRFVMAALWMMNRSTVEKIGLFSPVFPHYGEDDDYLNRMRYHQIKIGIATTAFGFHDREFREVSYEKYVYLKYKVFLVGMNNLNKSYGIYLLKAIFTLLYSSIEKGVKGKFSHVRIEFSNFINLIAKKSLSSLKARKINRVLKTEVD